MYALHQFIMFVEVYAYSGRLNIVSISSFPDFVVNFEMSSYSCENSKR